MRPALSLPAVIAFLLSVYMGFSKLHAQSPSIGTSLDTLFQNRIAKKEIAGVVCLISQNGKVIYEKAFGYRSIEEGLPMQKTSLFRLQSMNKAIISLAALKLVDQGKISLDEPASTYFPELRDKKVGVLRDGNIVYVPADKPITLRHVLSHSFGIGSSWNAGALKSVYEAFEALAAKDYKEAMQAYLKLPLIDHPGNGWHYGWGHLIMALVIEKVTGVPIKEYLGQEIFRPLAMNHTTFSLSNEKQKELAKYYSVTDSGGLKQTMPDPGYSWGTDLFSTAQDYHKFCLLLLNNGRLNGKQFIRPESIRELYKPVVGHSGEAIGWQKGYAFGLGVSVRVDDDKPEFKGSLGDYGWFGGFNTAF